MENRKDIGNAISDRLNSLDKTPREQVWIGIHEELQKKKKRRFVLFFFWSTIAALLVTGAISVFYLYNQNDSPRLGSPNGSNGSVIVNETSEKTSDNVSTDKKQALDSSDPITNIGMATSYENKYNENNNLSKNNSINTNKNSDKSINIKVVTKNRINKTTRKRSVISQRSRFNSFYPISKKSQNVFTKQAKGQHIEASGKMPKKFKGKQGKGKKMDKKDKSRTSKAIEELLLTIQNQTKKDSNTIDLSTLQDKALDNLVNKNKTMKKDSILVKKEKEKDLVKNINMYKKEQKDSLPILSYKKFDLDVFVSPDIYLNFDKSPTIDNPSDTLSRRSATKFGFGIGLTYALSEKLSFRIGYSRINLSYTTNVRHFPSNTTGEIANFSGINYNPNVTNYSIFIAAEFTPNSSAAMDVTEKISYTEIPFEFKYKIIDKKFELKSSAGFSYLILSENKTSIITSNGYSQEIGKTKDLLKAAFSFNLGIEIDYPIFKNLKLFIQPTFNYQVKAFSNSDFKPNYFGIRTGIRYSFNMN